MNVLPTEGPAPRSDRPATQLLHDEPNTRVVSFHVAPGQQVPPHTSNSTVVVQVLEGEGLAAAALSVAERAVGEVLGRGLESREWWG